MSSSFETQSSNGVKRPNHVTEAPVDPLATTDSQRVYSEAHPDHKRTEPRTADWSAPDSHAAKNEEETTVEPQRVSRVRMPEAPLRVVLARRVQSIAHGSRTFITEYPWLSLAMATGAGILVGRALPSRIQRKIGMGVLTFVGRRLIRTMFRAVEVSVPNDVD